MESAPITNPAAIAARPDSFHRWRSRNDYLSKNVKQENFLSGDVTLDDTLAEIEILSGLEEE